MPAFPGITVPLERFSVMVQRWGCDPFQLSVPAFSQEDAIDRVTAEASQNGYYNFMKAYAPEPGSGRQEGGENSDDNQRSS